MSKGDERVNLVVRMQNGEVMKGWAEEEALDPTNVGFYMDVIGHHNNEQVFINYQSVVAVFKVKDHEGRKPTKQLIRRRKLKRFGRNMKAYVALGLATAVIAFVLQFAIREASKASVEPLIRMAIQEKAQEMIEKGEFTEEEQEMLRKFLREKGRGGGFGRK